MFQLFDRRHVEVTYTKEHIVRDQIDYILITSRYRNLIKAVKVHPGALVNSDHNPLIGVMQVRLKKIKRRQHKPTLNTTKIKETSIHQILKQQVNLNLNEIREIIVNIRKYQE